jgi:hypothetical protein
MKTVINYLTLVLVFLTLTNCSKDSEPINEAKNASFLAFYKPSGEQILGEDKLVAKLSVDNGNLSYSAFLDAYPGSGMTVDCSINHKKLAMGLEWRAFDNQGIYMDLNDPDYETLPLATPKNENYYAFFQGRSQNVSDNGYVIYISGTNNIYYGDEGRRILMRYNPKDASVISVPSPVDFALSQPEKGSDTDFGQYNTNIFASPDGRYAYGHIEAFGTEGGGIHWDYEFLFQFDFENLEFTRLGDAEDNDVTIYAMTLDRKNLIYSNHGVMKMLNLETGTTSLPDSEMNLVNVQKNSWNNYGACVGTTSGKVLYKNFVNNTETTVCDTYGRIRNAMFSENGDQIYFIIDSDERYLCLSEDLSENSPYDTLCSVPSEFYDLVLIK